MPGLSTLEFFEDDRGRSPVEKWMDDDLTDLELAALLSAFEHVLSHHGLNVCASEWGKQLGDGLFEFRVRHTAAEIDSMFGGAPPGKGHGKSCCASSATPSVTRSSSCSTATTRARTQRQAPAAGDPPGPQALGGVQAAPGPGAQVRAARRGARE
jgi:hypothetical protein